MIAEETEIEESKAAEVIAECEITIRYREIGKGIQEIKLPKGDLYVICNVLYDYVDLLRVTSESQEQEIHKELYKLHAERCEKIRHKIQHKLGYCVEKAIKKMQEKERRIRRCGRGCTGAGSKKAQRKLARATEDRGKSSTEDRDRRTNELILRRRQT